MGTQQYYLIISSRNEAKESERVGGRKERKTVKETDIYFRETDRKFYGY
jgi:hypothetical protein